MDGSLKNAIIQAAADTELGELIQVGRAKIRSVTEACSYSLATVKLADGRLAQAQLKITTDQDDFICNDEQLVIIEMGREEVCDGR